MWVLYLFLLVVFFRFFCAKLKSPMDPGGAILPDLLHRFGLDKSPKVTGSVKF
jgi:hypothetical protein